MDTWVTGYNAPSLDANQDVANWTGRINEGVTTLTFARKRDTGDSQVRYRFILERERYCIITSYCLRHLRSKCGHHLGYHRL